MQKRGLQMGADVVIATPGRLISHLTNSRVDLSHVDYLILDEADRMLDMGFYDDIMQIVSYMPKSRQTLMFSATLPPKIRQMAKQILNDPAEVNIAISKPNEAIEQGAYICYRGPKAGDRPRDVLPAFGVQDYHLLLVEAKSQGAGPYAQANEARRGSHAFRLGSGEARAGDARF